MDPQNKVKNLFEKRKIQNYLISVKKEELSPLMGDIKGHLKGKYLRIRGLNLVKQIE